MVEIRNLVVTMVKSIVDNPEEVHIVEEESDRGLFYEISVSKDDVGKLIGKGGRIATAIRTISKASGNRYGVRVSTNIMKEPYDPNE